MLSIKFNSVASGKVSVISNLAHGSMNSSVDPCYLREIYPYGEVEYSFSMLRNFEVS